MNINLHYIKSFLAQWVLTHGVKILLIILVVFLAIKFISKLTKKIVALYLKNSEDIEYYKKMQTLGSITKSVIDFVIIAIAGMLILEELGINIGPILAAAGVLGIAVGFGSQRLVEDLITGFIILVTNQIRVGDVVQIGDKSGFVEQIDLKMVVLRDVSGNVHFIRNGRIDVVTNMTKDYSYYLLEIGVSYKENIERVIEILKQIDEEMRQSEALADDILEPIEILGLDRFDDSAIIIKARIKTKPIKQWAVGRDFNLRLKKRFDELGIEIPFPQRTLYISKPEELTKESD